MGHGSATAVSPAQRALLQAGPAALDRRARAVAILHGPVAVDRWCAAIRQLAGEQEILRTRIGRVDGLPAPVQRIDESAGVEIAVGADAGWGALERNPGQGAVLRTSLSPAAGGGWRWRISLPLLNADRRGLVNLAAAAGRRYAGLADELPQYAAVGEWQQELLVGEETAAGRRFWQERRPSLGEPLRLWAPVGGGARACRSLDGALWQRLRALAGEWGVPPELVALAGWQALAARQTADPYTRRWLGMRVDGRQYEPLADCLGPFAKDLPIPGRLIAGEGFRQLVARLAEEVADAAGWEEYLAPGDWLPELGFTYDAAIGPLRCGEVEVEIVEADAAAAEAGGTAVRLWCVERGDGLDATLASAREGRWGDVLEQWEELLRGAAAAPDREVGALPLLPARQRSALLGWGRGERTAANAGGGGEGGGSVLSQIAAQARQRAGAPAVAMASAGADAWTYEELWRRAARVARALRRRGVGRESIVGLYLSRSREQVAVLLGVWRAGGAYLPLAPADPPARLAAMVEAAGAGGVVSAGQLADRLRAALGERRDGPAVAVWEAADLLGEGEAAADEPAAAGGEEAWPEQAAYVIYTSGSTGRPKGVVVPHGALGNYVRWARAAYGDSAPIDSLVHTPLSFDLTVTSLLVPLAAGGRVELVGEAGPGESAAGVEGVEGLRRALERDLTAGEPGATRLLKLTPSHLRALSAGWEESGETERRLRCRAMVVGGEPLASDLAARWRVDGGPGGSGGRRLWNEYGPTEAVVGCSAWEAGDDDAGAGNVPIGRPLANVELYVVDAWGELVPEGVAGELWVGGAGLARGYLADPAATAKRFVPDAWGRGGSRLYRTGDRARWRAGGELEHLGRVDEQLKIRGHRIEPAEVEAALRALPGVREAVVVARAEERRPEAMRLVAYVVGDAGPEREWRATLRRRLPEPMVPAALVRLERLPLTAHGKVDRRSLPAPRPGADAAPWEPPRTAAERALAAIWSELLGGVRVGRDDNFFELGGDSILSVQAAARARRHGLRLAPRQVFEHQTLQALAAVAEPLSHSPAAAGEPAPPAPAPPTALRADELASIAAAYPDFADAYALTPLQAGLLFHALYEPRANAYYSQLHCTLAGELDAPRLRRAWQRLGERHEMLRTAFVAGLRQPVQVVLRAVELPWRQEDWRHLDQDEQRRRRRQLAAADRELGYDLERAPLTRLGIVRLADGLHWLLWSHHHLILDGWSMAVLVRELFEAYEAEGLGRAPGWRPARPFRDYVDWLRRQDHDAAEAYWRHRLAGVEATVVAGGSAFEEAPGGGVPAGAPGGAHRRRRRELGETASRRLEAFARSRRLTLNTVVQGAWCLVLASRLERDEVVFGATVAGRPSELEGVEDMVGLFINTLPIRARVQAEADLEAWLRQLQLQTAAARQYEHTALPDVQRWSGLAAGQPLFDSLLVFENLPAATPTHAGGLAIADLTTATDNNYAINLVVIPGDRLALDAFHAPRATSRSAALLADLVAVLDRIAQLAERAPLTVGELAAAAGIAAGDSAAALDEATFQLEVES